MSTTKSETKSQNKAPMAHGDGELPLVTVDDYNIELRDDDGFIGDKASRSVFKDKLDEWRKRIRKGGDDPIGKTPTKELSKKKIDALLNGDDKEAAALVMGAVDDFAHELAAVVTRFLKQPGWKKTQRIVVGGGFKDSAVGELAIARTTILLKAEGREIELVPIAHHPDDAGLMGSAYLMPVWMLEGYQAMLAVDIGGTNVRAGIVKLPSGQKDKIPRPEVWKSEIWRHADEKPSRGATIEHLVAMLKRLADKAGKVKLKLAPLVGIACPGIIKTDGSIERGGQNLPGGNWESDRFNLPGALMEAIPQMGDHDTFVMMHNDAVVQGLSQIPFMQDVSRWAVLTIGTGLGNAHFTNRQGK